MKTGSLLAIASAFSGIFAAPHPHSHTVATTNGQERHDDHHFAPATNGTDTRSHSLAERDDYTEQAGIQIPKYAVLLFKARDFGGEHLLYQFETDNVKLGSCKYLGEKNPDGSDMFPGWDDSVGSFVTGPDTACCFWESPNCNGENGYPKKSANGNRRQAHVMVSTDVKFRDGGLDEGFGEKDLLWKTSSFSCWKGINTRHCY